MIVNLIFLLVSLLIFCGYGIAGLAYLLGAVVISWTAGLLTPRWRWAAVISVVLNAVSLLMLKLQPLTGMPWLSVMGMSYFTLQIMAYQIDVFREKYPPERSFIRYALYVTWIPHLFMGPIERYDVMAPHLTAKRNIGWDSISRGALRILLGAVKKLVIAARLNVIISAIGADTASYNGAFALAAMLLYSLQLYCDFSGGIDMVLGVSQTVGIPLSENFDRPYFSQSIREFWRRWHITLGSWLRDYIYIPLGGSRKGIWRKLLNTVVTFLVSGLWHGVQYLLWGFLNGIFVCVGDRLKTRSKTLNRIGTFLLISLLWAFFVWPDTVTALKMLASVFTVPNYAAFVSGIGTLGLTAGDWIVLGVALLLLWAYDLWAARLTQWVKKLAPAARLGLICVLGLLVLVFGMYGIGFNVDSFIYGGF